MRQMAFLSIAMVLAAGCQGLVPVSTAATDGDPAAPGPTTPAASALSVTGNADRGATRSAELYCDACHGSKGNSEIPEWPSLAGQNATYHAEQLALYRSGARPSAEMQPIAAPLSDADIADLAAYYAVQALTEGAAAAAGTLPGAALYREGDPARAIPACGSCHGLDGRGNPATGDPALRAQPPGYVSRQLEAYARRTRYTPASQAGGNLAIMYASAEKLTPGEIRDLAAYIRALR